jgi:N-acetylmuramoyl-L-alanine amidase
VARHAGGHASATYEEGSGAALAVWRLVVVLSCVTAIGAMFYGLLGAQQATEPAQQAAPPLLLLTTTPMAPPPTAAPSESAAPSQAPAAAIPSTLTPTPGPPHVGIVAGHRGNDTGAVCPDGLREVDINFDVAQRVVSALCANGYQVDLLEEFDERLWDYRADALVSIHADSCDEFRNATPPASGFKVANSMVPEAEDRLVACLKKHYAANTLMYFHANSITDDMSHYHTFYEINGQTPGAIIETGFMFADRTMLTERPDLVAQGIAEGIVCFIEGETP